MKVAGSQGIKRSHHEIVQALEKSNEELELKSQSLAQAHRELETSRKRYDDLYDTAPAGFVTLTAEGLIREINLPAVRLLNHYRGHVIGRPFVNYIAHPDREKFLEHFVRCRENANPTHALSIELELLREHHARPAFIELLTIPATEAAGKEPLYCSVLRDITAFKQMQDVQRWLAAIVNSSDDAIIGINLQRKILSSNKGAFQLYGYTPEELIGKSVFILVPKELQSRESLVIERARHGETINHYETVRQHKNGSRIEVSLTISPIRDSHGKIIGASKIARDISERKHSEKELAAILEREKAANRAKDDFLAALSHELRTPLNPVLLLASDSARDPELPPRARTNFDTIRKNIELEARLIDDLLDLTSITHGKLILNKAGVDVHDVINEAVLAVLTEAKHKQIELTVDCHASEHEVFGDGVRLQQVFWNVLKNAVKFTPEGGLIKVETLVPGDSRLLITISDTGIGMTPEEAENIFRAFSQGTHLFGGLGLGLAISRALVELHSGTIRAASAGKGKGATFSIELPLITAEQRDKTLRLRSEPAPPPVVVPRQKSAHILLVEDHEPTRRALTQLLLRRQYKVTSASLFTDARAQLEGHENFDLLISDIGLPDGSGYDLMKAFREKFGANGIALTGYGMEQDVERSHEVGFRTHLTKPVRIESLEAALATAFEVK